MRVSRTSSIDPPTADRKGEVLAGCSSGSNESARRVVTVSHMTARYDPKRIYTYQKMLQLVKMCQANWPDYHHWAHVKFKPEPIAVMTLRFIRHVEQHMDLANEFTEYLFNNDVSWAGWGMAIQIEGIESAEALIEQAVNYLDHLPVVAYGVSLIDDDGYNGYWLMAALSHVTSVNTEYIKSLLPRTFAAIENFIPVARINPDRSFSALQSLPADILRARGYEDLATILMYCCGATGNEYADYSFDEVVQFEDWYIDWTTPGELERHVQMQNDANAICSLYQETNSLLDGDIIGTREFIEPLYAALDEAHRRMDDAEREGTLIDLLGPLALLEETE